jgi:hypothetical protein
MPYKEGSYSSFMMYIYSCKSLQTNSSVSNWHVNERVENTHAVSDANHVLEYGLLLYLTEYLSTLSFVFLSFFPSHRELAKKNKQASVTCSIWKKFLVCNGCSSVSDFQSFSTQGPFVRRKNIPAAIFHWCSSRISAAVIIDIYSLRFIRSIFFFVLLPFSFSLSRM